MPFTLSHPAAALIFRRSGLPVAATVAGTMAPDVPMFLPGPVSYSVTHSWRGVVTVDVLIGVVGVVLWMFLMRDALVDLAPVFVRERLAPTAPYAGLQWALAPIAVLLGAATHVGWDAFTHRGRWGVQHVPWLRSTYWGHAGYNWAQAVSSVAGLIVVVGWVLVVIRRGARRPRSSRVGELSGRGVWAAPVVVAAAGGLVAGLVRLGTGVHAAVKAAAVSGTTALAVVVVALSLVWRVLVRRADQRRSTYGGR